MMTPAPGPAPGRCRPYCIDAAIRPYLPCPVPPRLPLFLSAFQGGITGIIDQGGRARGFPPERTRWIGRTALGVAAPGLLRRYTAGGRTLP